RVDDELQTDAEVARREPRPRGRDLASRGDGREKPEGLVRAGRVDAEEGPDRTCESDEDARRGDPGGGQARDPRSAQQDQDRADERREQVEPGAAGHPRSSESLSTSSERFRRLSATTRPSPTQTSDAAMAITPSAKIWPAPLCQWRASAISARLPALSISSSEGSTTVGFRPMGCPSAQVPARPAA